MRFRTVLVLQMWLLVALVLGAALGAIAFVVGRAALRQANTDLARAHQVLDEDAARRRALYQAQAAIMAEEPRLKAVVVTEDVNLETVLDVAGELRRELRAERLVLIDAEGRVVVDPGHVIARGADLAADPLVARALAGGEASAIWVADGKAWEMSAHRLAFGETAVGVVAIGYPIDARLIAGFGRETATEAIVLLGGKPLVSTLPAGTPVPLADVGASARLDLGSAPYVGQVVAYPERGDADLRVVLLRPLEDALAAKNALFGVIAAIAAAGLVVVLVLARALARRLSQPLDRLVAFTEKIAEGKLDARVEAEPAVAEIATLAVSMNLMARKLEESKGRLILADRMASVGTLASGVAHEINNPLTWVLGNLDYLAGELPAIVASLPPDRARDLEDVVEQSRDGADRVRKIVRDLKLFSRADEENLGPVDVRRVLELAVNMTKAELKHRARLTRDYGDTRPVLANESRLGQVFVNLLVNAAQAITEGKLEENEVRLSTRSDGNGRVIVEVQDTGNGIPPDIRARIFDPFFTTKKAGLGTGLGLSICHGIITAAGGEIEVDSEVGRGTTFRVILPAAASSAPLAPVPPAHTPLPRPAPRGRVLVVDDEAQVAAMLERELRAEHDVVVAASGRQALDRLQGDDGFDVIVCDLMMPEVTGMDLHAELARVAPELVERLVFVTGGAFTAHGHAFLGEVPNERFEKPVDVAELRRLIRERVQKSRMS